MKELDNIEKVFRDRLKDHSTSVDPAVWTQVSQSLGHTVAGSSAASTGFLSTLLGKAVVFVMAVAAISGSIYLLNQDSEHDINTDTIQTENVNVPSEEKNIANLEILDEDLDQNEKVDPIKESPVEKDEVKVVPDIPKPIKREQFLEEITTSLPIPQLGTDNKENDSNSEIEIVEVQPKKQPNSREEEIIQKRNELSFESSKYPSTEEMVVSFSQEPREDTYYMWDFGDGYESDEESPEHTYEEEGNYIVKFREYGDGFSQEVEKEIKVYLDYEIFIPNIFTPNHDHLNQTFDVLALSKNVRIGSFEVFDQNSKIVFKSDENIKRWNGEDLSGQPCVQGYYFYTINFIDNAGNVIPKSGKIWLGRS